MMVVVIHVLRRIIAAQNMIIIVNTQQYRQNSFTFVALLLFFSGIYAFNYLSHYLQLLKIEMRHLILEADAGLVAHDYDLGAVKNVQIRGKL